MQRLTPYLHHIVRYADNFDHYISTDSLQEEKKSLLNFGLGDGFKQSYVFRNGIQTGEGSHKHSCKPHSDYFNIKNHSGKDKNMT